MPLLLNPQATNQAGSSLIISCKSPPSDKSPVRGTTEQDSIGTITVASKTGRYGNFSGAVQSAPLTKQIDSGMPWGLRLARLQSNYIRMNELDWGSQHARVICVRWPSQNTERARNEYSCMAI